MKNKNILIGAGIVVAVIIGIGLLSFFTRPLPVVSTDELGAIEEPLTETPAGEETPAKPAILSAPTAVMPAGAHPIDDYSFTDAEGVHFLSITSTSSLAIPDADAASFKRTTGFMTFPGSAVVNDCGVSGSFAFYTDVNRVYFYQRWLTPQFRTSRVEVIAGAKPETFKVVNPTSFLDGTRSLSLTYEVSTSTCLYAIQKS